MKISPFSNRLNRYFAKTFLIKFLQIISIFSLIIFFINLIESLDRTSDAEISVFMVAYMSFLKIPDFLSDIISSLILFSAITTFFSLSIKSEVTISRSCGYSLWHIIYPIAFCAFLIGIFWITIFNTISIKMTQKFNSLESYYIEKETREVVESSSGIWIKQANLEIENEEILIQAKKVYKKNIELKYVSIWQIDKAGKFYKKIDARQMLLKDGYWLLKDVVINDFKSLNAKYGEYVISTNLEEDFIIDKVVSNFENVKLFSVFDLPNLIASLKSAGFQSAKFQVYFNSLLTKPILFVAMVLIASFFGINNFRSQSGAIMIFLGMVSGLALYIILNFVAALGSSKILPVFTSTWVITFICIAIGVLLIYKKENV